MKKIYTMRVFLTLCLLAICTCGGGNLKAEEVAKTVTLDFEGSSGTFPYDSNWTASDFTDYTSLSHNGGGHSASTAGQESGYVRYNYKLTKINKVVFYISKTTTNKNANSYYQVETSENGKDWTVRGQSDAMDKVTKNAWTETTITLATPVDGFIRISYTGTTAIRLLDDITVYYTEDSSTPSQSPQTLSFPNSSYSALLEKGFTKPELTGAMTAVTYRSSDESVATVDNDGNVTLLSTGTTTISADAEATAEYFAGHASYTLTVKKFFAAPTFYKKITDANAIDGGVYLIVCESKNDALGTIDSDRGNVAAFSAPDGIYDGEVNTDSAPYEITMLKQADGTFVLLNAENKYLKGASTSNDIGYETSITNDCYWNVAIVSGNAEITLRSNSSRKLQRNTSSAMYRTYTGAQTAIQLYQKVTQMDLAAATGGYGTFYTDCAYAMPAGVTGYAVTAAQEAGTLTTATAYAAEQEVPAQTPLLVKGTAGTYYPAVLNKAVTPTYEGSNLLEGTRAADGKTAQSAKSNVYYYKLTVGEDSKPGFYWGASNGSAFELTKGTTAYLTVDTGAGAEGFRLDLGTTTGIGNVQTARPADIFDLSGRRVQRAAKGFYIVDGQKVLVK